MKTIFSAILKASSFLLLVVILSTFATPASAQYVVSANCAQVAEAVYNCSCPYGYYAQFPGDPTQQPDPNVQCVSTVVPGSGGDGWPGQCDWNTMQIYWFFSQTFYWIDPDQFYAAFGCYPY